jgi:hypothetical protein
MHMAICKNTGGNMSIKKVVYGCIGMLIALSIVDQTDRFFSQRNTEHHPKAVEFCRNNGNEVPPASFSTDVCSLWPNGTWGECCIAHDYAYWCGGSRDDRKVADTAMAQCINEKVPYLGSVMHLGVRIGGAPHMPTPWRWGYGWKFPRGYRNEKD